MQLKLLEFIQCSELMGKAQTQLFSFLIFLWLGSGLRAGRELSTHHPINDLCQEILAFSSW